jgi:hypothetical protein
MTGTQGQRFQVARRNGTGGVSFDRRKRVHRQWGFSQSYFNLLGRR